MEESASSPPWNGGVSSAKHPMSARLPYKQHVQRIIEAKEALAIWVKPGKFLVSALPSAIQNTGELVGVYDARKPEFNPAQFAEDVRLTMDEADDSTLTGA